MKHSSGKFDTIGNKLDDQPHFPLVPAARQAARRDFSRQRTTEEKEVYQGLKVDEGRTSTYQLPSLGHAENTDLPVIAIPGQSTTERNIYETLTPSRARRMF